LVGDAHESDLVAGGAGAGRGGVQTTQRGVDELATRFTVALVIAAAMAALLGTTVYAEGLINCQADWISGWLCYLI
jgi:hypothetical protein